ncbi:hypothetical protein TPHA_0N00330 [Tetrapisispora phaffii CBS 4417]|uniref:Meiotic sister-chromatid recombination protein 6, mitochondrial n=1 Tax=Tetrapisispora phaffii (strain ATCC 24235 / CBS 4417 / NBRC 1672 / NRRL Y-8282 / UCD 70-5) TaxID=1071381 RepID=G8C0Y6_TETPH|nr:hypothetical protein TPHA_0N00330 [Tetrapisispora phaffii CBS 4417]CCE65814.1 hypothetical protein TPHA_0N00330 [Tetrapisispora phaffii CBS 4417]
MLAASSKVQFLRSARLVLGVASTSIRCLSTQANSAIDVTGESVTDTVIYPMSTLAEDLNQRLLNNQEPAEVYAGLKTQLQDLNGLRYRNAESNGIHPFAKSYFLNEPLCKLLEKSSSAENSTISPYEILNTMIDYKLAKPLHFEIVMKQLLMKKEYKDVIALWVKFLESPLSNMKILENDRARSACATYLIVAYLNLPDVNVNYETVKQILQQGDDFVLPLRKIRRVTMEIYAGNMAMQEAKEAQIQNYYRDYVNTDPKLLMKELDSIISPKQSNHLTSSYAWFKSAYSTKDQIENVNVDIVAKFMEKFIFFGKEWDAIGVYNDFKKVEDIKKRNYLNKYLLLAISHGPNAKNVKLTRIVAVWNSLIKPLLKDLSEKDVVSSYNHLFQAFMTSNNAKFVQEIYEKDLTPQLKNSKILYETYLRSLLKNVEFKYSDLLKLLEDKKSLVNIETIDSTDFINDILLKLIHENQQQTFTEVYESYFTNSKKSKRKPALDIIITKLISNYKFHMSNNKNDIGDFNFLGSISQNKNRYQKVSLIFQKFINTVWDIQPVNDFFTQIKTPINSSIYSLYIKAQFDKPHGSYEVAEITFKEYIKIARSLGDHSSIIGRNFVMPMIRGITKFSLQPNNRHCITMLPVYLDFADKLDFQVNKSIFANIIFVLFKLSQERNLNQNEKTVIKQLFERIKKIDSFTINSKYLEVLNKL